MTKRLRIGFRVLIPVNIFIKLLAIVKHSEVECGGLLCGETSDDSIKVEDAVLLNQKASVSNVALDDTAVQKFMLEDGRKIVGWFHIHLNTQPPFFSHTDHRTSEIFAKSGFCLSLVLNRKGEYKASVYHKSSSFNLIFEQQVVPELVFDEELEESVKKELNEKVRKASPKIWGYGYDGFLPATGYYQSR